MKRRISWLLLFTTAVAITALYHAVHAWATPASGFVATTVVKGTFGPIEVPADRLWGAQTQRSLEHFRISTEKMPPALIRALLMVKRSAARVNIALYRRGIESRFVTLMYGALEPDGQLTYCNAGHNPPLVVGKTGVRHLDVGGPIVGLFEGATFREDCVTLVPGDWLIVFSDGVSEAMSLTNDEYGEERILQTVEKHLTAEPPEMLQAIFTDVRAFTKGAAQSDDITALVLRYGA